MRYPTIKHLDIPEELKQCGFSAIRITGKSLIVNCNNSKNQGHKSSLDYERSDLIVIHYDQKDFG
jgi:hypothetical protein